MSAHITRKHNKAGDGQRAHALRLLGRNGMMRTREFVTEGVAATTLARMERDGEILRLSRGLYQLADA